MKHTLNNHRGLNNLLRALSCIVVLGALVLVIHTFTGIFHTAMPDFSESRAQAADGSKSGNGSSVSTIRQAFPDFPLSTLASLQAPGRPGAEEGALPAGANPSGDAAESNRPVNTSHTISNTPVDIASLDTNAEGWGPGTDCDEKNRPNSALSYQEKYGKYNANFIVPDSDKIYLTFDEGYENGRTADILDVLKEKNVQTVFFVTSQYVKQNPDLIRRMIDEGHTVGAHSVTHPAKGLPSQSVEQQQREITELHDYVKENFDYEMHLFRFPAGIFSEQSLAIVNNCNYKSVFWSFAYLDYDTENQPDPAQALEKVKGRLHPGAIYLLHAVSSTNAQILGEFIDYIRQEGYEIGMFD